MEIKHVENVIISTIENRDDQTSATTVHILIASSYQGAEFSMSSSADRKENDPAH